MKREPAKRSRLPDRYQLAIALAAFCTGAALLAIELAASRVLAPYFGGSLYVWGSLIGVVLAGLALGYWLGGAIVDRWPRLDLLLGLIAAGALATVAIPLVSHDVMRWVVDWDPGPRADPLLAALILFAPASVLLAAATPTAVRLSARSGKGVGGIAGRLFAISTLGSIAGTFATAFWLLPEIGTHELFGIVAGVLLAAAMLVALTDGRLAVALVLALAAWSSFYWSPSLAPTPEEALSEASSVNWSPIVRLRGNLRDQPRADLGSLRILFRQESRYHRIAVTEDRRVRYLRFDNVVQSGMYLHDIYSGPYPYPDLFELGEAYDPSARSMLFIGLGGATAIKRIWRDFPSLKMTAVEVDPVVIDVARRYFSLPSSPRLKVVAEDGRRFLDRSDRRYDLIAIDVSYADGLPFHMATLEFLRLVHEHLAPGGVVMMNVVGRVEGPGSRLFRSLYRTYRTIFPTVVVHPVVPSRADDPEGLTNVLIFAADKALPAPGELLERWRRLRPPRAAGLERAILDRDDAPIRTEDVPILTDDYAPTDALLVFGQ
jgi:spermidine synthase